MKVNQEYDLRMTASRRRKAVDLARDVLAQLRAGRMDAESVYASVLIGEMDLCSVADQETEEVGWSNVDNFEFTQDKDFKKEFKNNKAITCQVCAMGSLFVSWVNKNNSFSLEEVNDIEGHEIIEVLDDVFSGAQLRLMEAVFEGGWVSSSTPTEYFEFDNVDEQELFELKVLAYHDKYESYKERLRAIMKNVIRNNGEFILPKRTVRRSPSLVKARS